MKEKKRKKKSKLTFLGAHSHRMNYYIISRQSFKFQKVAKNGQESRPEDASPDNQDRVFSCPREFFSEILLNQTEIRLYLPFSDWLGAKRTSVWFQINRKMVNTIWFRFELIRFRKDFSMCGQVEWKAALCC